MKKVLILAYDFPPYVSVGGLRPYNWYKYFREFDIDPIVVTRQWSNEHGNSLDYVAASKTNQVVVEENNWGTVLKSPYKPNLSNKLLLKYGENRFRIFRKAITAYFEFAQFLYITGPKKELYKAANNYLKNNHVDAILVTGDPFILFSYADRLSRKYNVPWIADYRDPWSQNASLANTPLIRKWNEHFEAKIVKSTTQIITVSEFLVSKISSLVKNKTFQIMPNGYDPDLIESVKEIQPPTDRLHIAFVGTIYEWHPWKSFLKVLDAFLKSNTDAQINLNFYGVNEHAAIEAYITTFHPELIQHISFTPRIPNKEVLEKLANNHVMLLFNYYSYMGTKIFDYLAIRRKMILCYANDSEANELKQTHYNMEEIEGISKNLQADLIRETTSGIVVEDANHLMEVLAQLWTEFNETRNIACDSTGVEAFSRKIQVQKLAKLIQTLRN